MSQHDKSTVCSGCGQSFGSPQELKDHEKTCAAVQGKAQGQGAQGHSGPGQSGQGQGSPGQGQGQGGQGQGGKTRGAGGQTRE